MVSSERKATWSVRHELAGKGLRALKDKNQIFVFLSYSHLDKQKSESLLGHLRHVLYQQQIEAWHDEALVTGKWEEDVNEAINQANVAVLLITPNYLRSHFVRHNEVQKLLHRQAEGLSLVPVITEDCNWTSIPWLQNPVILHQSHDLALPSRSADEYTFYSMAEEIGNAVNCAYGAQMENSASVRLPDFRSVFLRSRVPSFFRDNREPAIRQRTYWLSNNLGLDDAFFASLLKVKEQQFRNWKYEHGQLPEAKLNELREFW